MQCLDSAQQGRRSAARHGGEIRTRLPEGPGARDQGAPIATRSPGKLREVLVQAGDIRDIDGAGHGEIAVIRIVGSLAVVDGVDQLRDQEIQVRIALPVGIGGHVDRNTINGCGQIGAVIEVVAAQEVLICLAVPRVLRNDQPGDVLEHLARTEYGPCLDHLPAHFPLRRGVHVTNQRSIADDLNWRQFGWRCRAGWGRERCGLVLGFGGRRVSGLRIGGPGSVEGNYRRQKQRFKASHSDALCASPPTASALSGTGIALRALACSAGTRANRSTRSTCGHCKAVTLLTRNPVANENAATCAKYGGRAASHRCASSCVKKRMRRVGS